MSVGLIPNVGATGEFTLTPPFDQKIVKGRIYTCIAVRTLGEIHAAGGDPESLYYAPNGLDDVTYQSDVGNGVAIVVLQASTGETLSAPSSYVASYPTAGGVEYANTGIAITLGALPTNIDLSVLKNSVSQLVQDKIGIAPQAVQEVLLSATKQVSQTDHANMELARQAATTDPQTERARAIAAESAQTAMTAKIQELETYILANIKPSTTPPPQPQLQATPDFTIYAATMQQLKAGVISDAMAATLVNQLQALDTTANSQLWNADPKSTEYSLQGAKVVSNGINNPSFPSAMNFKYLVVLQLRSDVVQPAGLLYLNYNLPTS